MKLFKTKVKSPGLTPMKTIKVGSSIPFNEMGERQNPALYIHTTIKNN